MTARSMTLVTELGREASELVRIYRHDDGYPSVQGLELAKAGYKTERRLKRHRHWCNAFLNYYLDLNASAEIVPITREQRDIAYLYVVQCDTRGSHDIVTIAAYRYDDRWSYYDTIEHVNPLFEGTPREFMDWVRKS